MPANIKPLKMCINITIPSVEDTNLSLYEAMCTLAGKLQDTINEINEILGEVVVTVNGKEGPNAIIKGSDISVSDTNDQSIDGALSQKYSAENPPPYPVTSVNGGKGDTWVSHLYRALNVPSFIVEPGESPYFIMCRADGSEIRGISLTVNGPRVNNYNESGVWTNSYPIYSEKSPPPYPVTSVNSKKGSVTLSASDISTASGTVQQDLITKLAFTGQQYTSWNSVRNQPCGVYRTTGFLPWSTSTADNGLLYIVGNNSSGLAYIFFRDSIPNSLYFAIGPGTSADDWFFVNGNPISG